MKNTKQNLDFDFVCCPPEELFAKLQTSQQGLTEDEALRRLDEYGYNEPAKKKKRTIALQILSRFLNPLVIVLLIIAGFSLFFGEKISAILVIIMAFISVFLSFIQEYRAGREAEKLREMVRTTATVHRNGKPKEVNIREIVPGDVVDLFAGDMIPADLRIVSCKDLFINQSSLTGESFPVEKTSEVGVSAKRSPADLANVAFMGSSVVSGTGLAVVIKTGVFTQFGEISKKLATITVASSFDKGIQKFPSQFLTFTSIYIVTIGLMLPFVPLGRYFGFVQPPPLYFLVLLVIVVVYLFLVQFVKSWFIKRYGYE